MRKVTSLFFTILVLSACSRDAATVGNSAISDRDIDIRTKVSEIYYPSSEKRYVGLTQLIKGYLSLEILRSFGHPADSAVLEQEAKRIDENTKAPEMLAKIKAVYGNDRKAYLRTFIALVYAERVLYEDVFQKSPDIHAAARMQAETLLRNASQTPAAFSETARQGGASVALLRISRNKGIQPQQNKLAPRSAGPIGIEQAERLIPILSRLSPGNMLPQIIDLPEAFQVMRFMRKAGSDFLVESATIPKRTFDDWYWEQASKFPVRVHDAALKEELLREVSWARNLRLN